MPSSTDEGGRVKERALIEKLVLAMRRADPKECEVYNLKPIEDDEWDDLIEAGEDYLEGLT
jgi:hypothetical protein